MQRQAAAPPPRQRRQPRRRPAAAPAARPARRLLALTALAALLAAAAAAPPGAAPPDANARPQTVGPGPLWAAGSTPVKISASSGDVFSALVNTTAVVRPMRQILGVSIEWQRAADYGGERWARVLQQLGPAPVLRVGGLSTELLQAVSAAVFKSFRIFFSILMAPRFGRPRAVPRRPRVCGQQRAATERAGPGQSALGAGGSTPCQPPRLARTRRHKQARPRARARRCRRRRRGRRSGASRKSRARGSSSTSSCRAGI